MNKEGWFYYVFKMTFKDWVKRVRHKEILVILIIILVCYSIYGLTGLIGGTMLAWAYSNIDGGLKS